MDTVRTRVQVTDKREEKMKKLAQLMASGALGVGVSAAAAMLFQQYDSQAEEAPESLALDGEEQAGESNEQVSEPLKEDTQNVAEASGQAESHGTATDDIDQLAQMIAGQDQIDEADQMELSLLGVHGFTELNDEEGNEVDVALLEGPGGDKLAIADIDGDGTYDSIVGVTDSGQMVVQRDETIESLAFTHSDLELMQDETGAFMAQNAHDQDLMNEELPDDALLDPESNGDVAQHTNNEHHDSDAGSTEADEQTTVGEDANNDLAMNTAKEAEPATDTEENDDSDLLDVLADLLSSDNDDASVRTVENTETDDSDDEFDIDSLLAELDEDEDEELEDEETDDDADDAYMA